MPLTSERVDVCKAIFSKLASGSTLLDQWVGTRLMVGLTADGGSRGEGLEWRERYREVQWLFSQQANESWFEREALVRRMTEGEVTTLQADLLARNRWPPPADWLPDDEGSRSLIQTGRPPPSMPR